MSYGQGIALRRTDLVGVFAAPRIFPPDREGLVSVFSLEMKKRRITAFPITSRGRALCGRLAGIRGTLRIHSPGELRGGRLPGLVREAFVDSDALLFIGATGIAVRTIAPLLQGKDKDPAVVVLDEKACFSISLLSGHLGGANDLAREVAALTGARPVISTATDINNLPSIEEVAQSFDLAIENTETIKALNSAILSGGPVRLVESNHERMRAMRAFVDERTEGIFSFSSSVRGTREGEVLAVVTPWAEPTVPAKGAAAVLVLRPREWVLGIGCRRGVSEREVGDAVDGALLSRGVSPLCIRNLATIDMKANEEGLVAFARKRGLEIDFFSAGELRGMGGAKSAFVMKTTGAHGVSEQAALRSSGAKRLWMKKKKFPRVTVAAARAGYRS